MPLTKRIADDAQDEKGDGQPALLDLKQQTDQQGHEQSDWQLSEGSKLGAV